MKLLFITHNLLPQPTGFGSAIHVWSIMKTMINRGHEVYLVIYDVGQFDAVSGWKLEQNQKLYDDLVHIGVIVHVLPRKISKESERTSIFSSVVNVIKRISNPSPIDYYAGPLYQTEVDKLITSIDPQVLFAYTFDATTLIINEKNRLRVSSVVDLDHYARKERKITTKTRLVKDVFVDLIDLILLAKMPKVMVKIVKNCDIVIEHANHHKEWLISKGVKQAEYLPVMVLDHTPDLMHSEKGWSVDTGKVKIALIGKLNGIATFTGLKLFVDEMLPGLEHSFDADHIDIHIIGGGEIPQWMLPLKEKSFIHFRGYVDDIQAEFLSTDIILVPTPIDLGFRTRIVEAFSYGCCVVAHTANSAGMPELVHEKNALLGKNSTILREQLIRCIESSELRARLGHGARKTFEMELSGDLVSNQLAVKIESRVNDLHRSK